VMRDEGSRTPPLSTPGGFGCRLFRTRGNSIAPAVSTAGMADGGSGYADTSNSGPTRAAPEAYLREHAVRLSKRREVVVSTAGQYRQLARDFHFMARDLPPGENRSMLLKMAEECDRLADQQEQATVLRQEKSKRARRREIRLAEKPIPERLHEDRQKQA